MPHDSAEIILIDLVFNKHFLLSMLKKAMLLKGGVCIFFKNALENCIGPVPNKLVAVRAVFTRGDARRERSSVHMTDISQAERRQKNRDGG